MAKRIETALIVLIYVLGAYLNWEVAYIGCAFNFGPKGAYECAVVGTGRLTLFCLLIFGIPTYHFGLRGGLKMGIAFLCSGFVWITAWGIIGTEYEIAGVRLAILKTVLGMVIGSLYLFAYTGEWKKNTNITRATGAE